MGLCGLCVPERYGGAGLGVLELSLCCEEMGGGAFPGPLLGHSLACLGIATGGSDAQRERWLPGLASGEVVGSIALGEAGERWDPSEWSLAVESGRLSGAKLQVPFVEV